MVDIHEGTVRVTVLDTSTGQTATDDRWTVYWWTMGNGSCDCNRQRLFGNDTDTGYCLGSKRYLVMAVESMPDGYTLDDFNADYPETMRRLYQTGN